MRRTAFVNSMISFEVEVGITGTYREGCPATPPSYASGGDPPEPDEIEDPCIVGLWAITFDGKKWNNHDLLDGVIQSDPGVQKLFANIFAHLGDDIDEALLSEAHEED